jgi:hypothetical protein
LLSIEKFEKAPCVFVYRDAIRASNFVEMVEEESARNWPYLVWNRSRTGDGKENYESEHRTSLEMGVDVLLSQEIVDDLKEIRDIFVNDIFMPMNECIWDYRNCFDLNLKQETGYALLKYEGGAEYHIHHDHASQNERVLSLVACLGSDDFSGGELEFNNFDLQIKLNKNDLILFPSNFPYTHIAHPVHSGVKYSLVTWFI